MVLGQTLGTLLAMLRPNSFANIFANKMEPQGYLGGFIPTFTGIEFNIFWSIFSGLAHTLVTSGYKNYFIAKPVIYGLLQMNS